jgi:hypothetical protein
MFQLFVPCRSRVISGTGRVFDAELERGRRSIAVTDWEITDRRKHTLILDQNTAYATALLIQ